MLTHGHNDTVLNSKISNYPILISSANNFDLEKGKRKDKFETAVSLLNPKTTLHPEILLFVHDRNLEADILHLKQKAVKFITWNQYFGTF